MIWPEAPISTVNVDQGTDKVRLARPQIKQAIDYINLMRAARGVAEGICDLDADGRIPEPRLNAQAVLNVLLTVHGPGSNLDADLLDGKDGAAYLLVDGTRAVTSDDAQGWNIDKRTTSTNTYQRAFTVHGRNTPGAVAAGYGLSMEFQLPNASGIQTRAGAIGWQWTAAGAGNEDADVVIQARSNGALSEVLRIRDGRQLQMIGIAEPAGTPPAGSFWVYAKAGEGLAVKDENDVEVVLSSGDNANHNTLQNLTVGDVHTQYVRTDGARVMTGNFQLGDNAILSTDLAADPAPPDPGQVQWYTKGGQLYYQTDSAVIGPIIAGGVTDHGALDPASLLDNDHPIYLLRQPTADVVLNDSGADIDWRIETVGLPDFFRIDAGTGVLGINTTGALVTNSGRLQVVASGAGHAVAATASGGAAFAAFAETGSCFRGIVSDTGQVGLFQRVAVGTPTTAILEIQDTGAAGFRALWVRQLVATASAARFDVAAGEVLSIDAAAVVINQVGADVDTRIESDGLTHAFFVDASANVVNINGTLTTGRFNVSGGGLDAIYAINATSGKSAMVAETTADLSIALLARGSGNQPAALAFSAQSVRGGAATFSKDLQGLALGNAFAAVFIDVLDNTDVTPPLHLNTFGPGYVMRASVGSYIDYVFAIPNGGGVEMNLLADDVAEPDSGYGVIYLKADGAYCRIGDTIVGPFGTGGGGGIITTDRGAEMRPDSVEQEIATQAGQPYTETTVEAPAGSQAMFVMFTVVPGPGGSGVTGGFDGGTEGSPTRFTESQSGTVGSHNNTYKKRPAPFPVGDTPMKVRVRPAGGGNWPDSNGRIVVSIFFFRCNAATS